MSHAKRSFTRDGSMAGRPAIQAFSRLPKSTASDHLTGVSREPAGLSTGNAPSDGLGVGLLGDGGCEEFGRVDSQAKAMPQFPIWNRHYGTRLSTEEDAPASIILKMTLPMEFASCPGALPFSGIITE
jgi:hypothetical protein